MVVVLTILFILTLFSLIACFMTGLGLGIGFLLKVFISNLETGHAIIAGSIIAFAATYFFTILLRALLGKPEEDDNDAISDSRRPTVVFPRELGGHRSGPSKSKGKKKGSKAKPHQLKLADLSG